MKDTYVRNRNIRKILAGLFLLQALLAYADGKEEIRFSTFDRGDGLSQLSVLDICQDYKGYMWFATRNGLNRFDGERFLVYKHHYADSLSLSGSQVNVLLSDPAHAGLWVGTSDGLNDLDLRTNRFTRFLQADHEALPSNNILSLCMDEPRGCIWVGTRLGLAIYRRESGEMETTRLPDLPKGTAIESLCRDKRGNLYIGTRNQGVWMMEARTDSLRRPWGDEAEGLARRTVNCLFQDSHGRLWAGTDDGLYLWDATRDQLRRFRQIPDGLANDHIRCMGEQNGRLVVGTFDGLCAISLDDLSITPYEGTYTARRGLNHFSVRSLCFDRVGTLWVGTWSGGINCYNPLDNRFGLEQLNEPGQLPAVLGESVYSEGKLWIASEGEGLIAWDPQTRQSTRYLFHPEETTQSHNIIKSLELAEGSIWCGTNDGSLYRFSLKEKRFTLVKQLERNRGIHAIYHDAHGHIWLGTTYRHGLTELLPDGTLRDHTPLGADRTNFSSARTLASPAEGRLLVGTRSSGLFEYDVERQQVVRYAREEQAPERHIDSNQIIQILCRKDGETWIATQGAGVYEYRPGEGIVRHISTGEGVPDEDVFALTDTGKELWITTARHVTELQPASGTTRTFACFADTEPMEFTPQGGTALPNGEICLGGNNGLLRFEPGKMTYNQAKPDIVLQTLSVNNRPVEPSAKGSILTESLDCQEALTLRHNENNFSISYCALNYLQHRQNRYAYRLEGHDAEWNYVGTRKEAFYTNIPPGEYLFRVKACNNDGIWNEEGRSIRIRILAPWWKTPWAYLLYVLAAAGIACTLVHHILRGHKLEFDLRLNEERRRQSEELQATKNRLFTHFSHELRTPLTLIIGPLEELLRRAETGRETREELTLILRNANRLLLLVNQLMDLQKNESGCLELHAVRQPLVPFLKEIYCAFRPIAEQRHIGFRLSLPEGEEKTAFDAGLLEKAVFNLLANAFKYTAPGESVELALLATEEGYHIRVSDTGRGIAPEERERIFEPFFQSETHKPVASGTSGTGIGLSLTKSIAKLHQGNIAVEANTPKGSRFTLFIPKREVPGEAQTAPMSLPAETAGQPPLPYLTGKCILIVEDNREIRSYLRRHLEAHYRILEAEEGQEALETIRRELPDLVVSDIMMPVMDGLELCRRTKEDLTTGHIPFILLTARTMLAHIKEGYLTGADDYVTKPFNMEVLQTRIHNLLQQRERLKRLYGKSFSPESLGFDTTSADERFMQKLFGIIEQNLDNPELNTELLCSELGMSRSNFYRKVKSVTELSLNDLIRHKRLEVAAQLLKTQGKSIAEVADATGFSSAVYFAKCFKDEYGMSPTKWLKENP